MKWRHKTLGKTKGNNYYDHNKLKQLLPLLVTHNNASD